MPRRPCSAILESGGRRPSAGSGQRPAGAARQQAVTATSTHAARPGQTGIPVTLAIAQDRGNGHACHTRGQEQGRGNGQACHSRGQEQGRGNGHACHSRGQEQGRGNWHAHHARAHDRHHTHADGLDCNHGIAGESRRLRCCGRLRGRGFRLTAPVSGRPLPSCLATAVCRPSPAADASATATITSVQGPEGAERFLSERAWTASPAGSVPPSSPRASKSSLVAASLFLNGRRWLSVTRILPPQDRPSGREYPGSVPLLPLAGLAA
jgi:hypothetical protein